MTKDQAAEMVKATAEQIDEDTVAHGVGFWACEEVACVERFLENHPDIEARISQKKPISNTDMKMVLGGLFRHIVLSYDVKHKPSTLMCKKHTAKYFELHYEVRELLKRTVMKMVETSDERNAKVELPENFFVDYSAVLQDDPSVGVFDEPEPEQPDMKYIVQPSVFAACVARETPKSPGNNKVLSDYKGLAIRKPVGKVSEALLKAMVTLAGNTPNFAPLLVDLKTYFAAQKKVDAPVGFQPILIVGEPGIGKTRIVTMLAACMGVQAKFINLSGAGDTMKLKGLSPSWGQSAPGTVARFMADSTHANPIIVLDEIDKAGSLRGSGGTGGAVQDMLLPLLERETACEFEDDYIQAPMDLSSVSWIATCNSIDNMPAALLSRFDIYFIDPLTRSEQASILNQVHDEIREANGFDCLNEMLCDDVADAFLSLGLSMRELRRELYKAQCRAVLRHTVRGKKEDVELVDIVRPKAKEPERPGIGFTVGM